MLDLPLPYVTSTTTGGYAYWLPAAGGGLVTSAEAAAGRAYVHTLRHRYTRRYRVTCSYTHRYADGQRSDGECCALVSSGTPDRRLAARVCYTQRTLRDQYTRRYCVTCRYTHRYADGQSE